MYDMKWGYQASKRRYQHIHDKAEVEPDEVDPDLIEPL